MKAYSLDLREKIIASYEEGETSIRKLAKQYRVSKGMVVNLIKLQRITGSIEPKRATGGKPSQLATKEPQLAQMVRQYPDYTLEEYCEYWDEQTGIRVSASTMCRALQKQNWSIKKTLRSSQATTAEKQKQRLEYWTQLREVEAKNLVFLDEMGVLLGLMRAYGRSLQGERVYDFKPFYRGKRVTVIGAISQTSVLEMKTIDKGMNGEDFQQFLP